MAWSVVPSEALTDLRAVLRLDAVERDRRLHDLGHTLGLRHLAAFVARLAIPPA